MLVCTIYILVGMAITTTIIELVRLHLNVCWNLSEILVSFQGENMQRAGERCKSWELKFRLSWSLLTLWKNLVNRQVSRTEQNSLKLETETNWILEKNNLALDLDIGNDLAELKANLAKFKKGKHGKGLDDINIEELDWVGFFDIQISFSNYFVPRLRTTRKSRQSQF